MIRVRKPASPEVLRTKGAASRRSLSNKYTRHAADYNAGVRTFSFKNSLYAHATVKAALLQAQHGKCCFCEAKIGHIHYGDVEHFRPKKGYRQQQGEPLTRPGYYWLAYEWGNLFLACALCNQQFKRNLFPLSDPNTRARSHKDDIRQETPLLLNPADDDPEHHISFREEIAFPRNGSLRGQTTIDVAGLNRPAIWERRLDLLEKLRLVYKVAQNPTVTPELRTEARAFLTAAVRDEAEYASMARAAIKSGFEI